MGHHRVTSDNSGAAPSKLWWRYLLLTALPLCGGAIWIWSDTASAASTAAASVATTPWWDALRTPFARFLLQLLVVLSIAKGCGALVHRFGQPRVIGEMLAGLLLGPSLFGWIWPQAQQWLFPLDGMAALSQISQLGVLVFMFAAGAEFDLGSLRGQRRRAVMISHAGIALPFLFGLLLAAPLHARYAPHGAAFRDFSLFLGIALSVTAFPVLLRILEDRGYARSALGTTAMACAAMADVTAWAILGLIVAAVKSQGEWAAFLRVLPAFAFAWFCLGWLRRRLQACAIPREREAQWLLGMVLAILVGGLITEAMGLHALFGAFLAGLAFSGNTKLRALVEGRIESFATVLLLPLYFASTGLRTQLDLLSGEEWLLCLGITLVATAGKLGGTVIAARLGGMRGADVWRLGVLMNTRGLMELIVLGLGYELGLIDRHLYAILVVGAIATTMMTGPLLGLIDWRTARAPKTAATG